MLRRTCLIQAAEHANKKKPSSPSTFPSRQISTFLLLNSSSFLGHDVKELNFRAAQISLLKSGTDARSSREEEEDDKTSLGKCKIVLKQLLLEHYILDLVPLQKKREEKRRMEKKVFCQAWWKGGCNFPIRQIVGCWFKVLKLTFRSPEFEDWEINIYEKGKEREIVSVSDYASSHVGTAREASKTCVRWEKISRNMQVWRMKWTKVWP